MSADNTNLVRSVAEESPLDVGSSAQQRNPIVEIDLDFLRKRQIFVSATDESSKIAISAFKSLRTHMLKAMQAHGVSSLTVTGTTKQVGKSTVAANLAVNIARHKRKHVLLADLDLRAPSIASLFGVSPGIGIDDVTDPGFTLRNSLIETNIPGLSILPCVRGHENSTEILLSNEMQSLLSVLLKPQPDHVVIFDAPPVLGCDDIAAVTSLLDLFLVVVGEDETSRSELRRSMQVLSDAAVAAIVLNKSTQNIFKRYYY